MHYILWVDIAWDVVIALAFFGIAAAIVAAVETGKVGVVLGRHTFYLIAAALAFAGIFRCASAIGLYYGDHVFMVAAAKTVTGFLTVIASIIVNIHVHQVKTWKSPTVDAIFKELHDSIEALRTEHDEKRIRIRSDPQTNHGA